MLEIHEYLSSPNKTPLVRIEIDREDAPYVVEEGYNTITVKGCQYEVKSNWKNYDAENKTVTFCMEVEKDDACQTWVTCDPER